MPSPNVHIRQIVAKKKGIFPGFGSCTLFYVLAGILISINYTANLISYLAISRPETPIKSLEEFSSREDWTLAVEEGVGDIGDWAVSDLFISI